MNELAPRYYPSGSPVSPSSRFGGQPVFIGIAALAVIVLGIGAIAAWRAYSGTTPELDRVVASRQLQARATQASAFQRLTPAAAPGPARRIYFDPVVVSGSANAT